MEAKDREVVEVVSVEPVSEARVLDVAQAAPGVVVAATAEEAPAEPSHTPLHKNGRLKDVLHSMLFVADEPLSSARLAEILELDEAGIEQGMSELEKELDLCGAIQLMRIAGGFQLCTRPEYADYCTMLLQPSKKKLSKAALETLAVVAYRQPCTCPEIEAVRGVNVDGVLKTLVERGLVKEAGRKQAPGRPILYATTPEFLEYFGLDNLSELPDIDMLAVEEITALEAQRDLFRSRGMGTQPEPDVEAEPVSAEPSSESEKE